MSKLAAKRDFKGALAALGGIDLQSGEKIRWLSASGDSKGAENLARKLVSSHQGEVLPLALLVEVLHSAGNTDAAATEFEKLTTLAGRADLDWSALKRLRPLADALDLPADWRSPTPPPADFGKRPAIETLGPLTFSPWSVPDFTLPTVHGERFSLEESRQKNRGVLVIFYLGSGCVHCVQQLQAFGPFTKQFEAMKIPIIAISSEDKLGLAVSLNVLAKNEKFPFPLASDGWAGELS